jgi:hypothetical protein
VLAEHAQGPGFNPSITEKKSYEAVMSVCALSLENELLG